jgi:hypothetical protein
LFLEELKMFWNEGGCVQKMSKLMINEFEIKVVIISQVHFIEVNHFQVNTSMTHIWKWFASMKPSRKPFFKKPLPQHKNKRPLFTTIIGA